MPSISSLHFRHVLYRYSVGFGEHKSVGLEVATCQRCEIWTLQCCGIRYFRYYISFVRDRYSASVGCTDPAHVELLALSVSLHAVLQTSRYFLYWMNPCGECVVTCDYAACRDDQFKCVNSGRCIPASWVCNGYNGCGDWSDERNCSELYFNSLTGHTYLHSYKKLSWCWKRARRV